METSAADIGVTPIGGSDATRELRVKIGLQYHMKLHALKILRNQRMSDTIQEALDLYFSQRPVEN